MKNKTDEITVIDIQLVATILSILSFIFTFILLYNQKLLKQKKVPLFSKKETLHLVALNRLFVLGIVFLFLGANALQLKLDKEKNSDLTYDYIEILASILTLTVSILSIYIAIKAIEKDDLSIDISADPAL